MTELDPYAAPTAEADVDEQPYQPKIFAFSGRIGRLRYLAYGGVYYLVFMLALAVVGGVLGAAGVITAGAEGQAAIMPLVIIGYLFFFVMFVALAVRRVHDVNRTGWLLLLLLVPLVNLVISLYLLFASGTKGANKYGAQPVKNHPALWLGLLFPLVMVVGILAAVAIPAYQDYVERAKAAQIQTD